MQIHCSSPYVNKVIWIICGLVWWQFTIILYLLCCSYFKKSLCIIQIELRRNTVQQEFHMSNQIIVLFFMVYYGNHEKKSKTAFNFMCSYTNKQFTHLLVGILLEKYFKISLNFHIYLTHVWPTYHMCSKMLYKDEKNQKGCNFVQKLLKIKIILQQRRVWFFFKR